MRQTIFFGLNVIPSHGFQMGGVLYANVTSLTSVHQSEMSSLWPRTWWQTKSYQTTPFFPLFSLIRIHLNEHSLVGMKSLLLCFTAMHQTPSLHFKSKSNSKYKISILFKKSHYFGKCTWYLAQSIWKQRIKTRTGLHDLQQALKSSRKAWTAQHNLFSFYVKMYRVLWKYLLRKKEKKNRINGNTYRDRVESWGCWAHVNLCCAQLSLSLFCVLS